MRKISNILFCEIFSIIGVIVIELLVMIKMGIESIEIEFLISIYQVAKIEGLSLAIFANTCQNL